MCIYISINRSKKNHSKIERESFYSDDDRLTEYFVNGFDAWVHRGHRDYDDDCYLMSILSEVRFVSDFKASAIAFAPSTEIEFPLM